MKKRQVLAFLMAMSVLVSTVFPASASGPGDADLGGSAPASEQESGSGDVSGSGGEAESV